MQCGLLRPVLLYDALPVSVRDIPSGIDLHLISDADSIKESAHPVQRYFLKVAAVTRMAALNRPALGSKIHKGWMLMGKDK